MATPLLRIGCITAALCALLVGCADGPTPRPSDGGTSGASAPTSESRPSSGGAPTTSQAEARRTRTVEAGLGPRDGTIQSGLRSTGGAGRDVTVLRDEDTAGWKAGRYRMTVSCVGRGRLDASLRIGDAHAAAAVPECSEDGVTADLHLTAPTAGTAVVEISPAEASDVVFGYAVRRD